MKTFYIKAVKGTQRMVWEHTVEATSKKAAEELLEAEGWVICKGDRPLGVENIRTLRSELKEKGVRLGITGPDGLTFVKVKPSVEVREIKQAVRAAGWRVQTGLFPDNKGKYHIRTRSANGMTSAVIDFKANIAEITTTPKH